MPAASGYREPSGVYFSEFRKYNIFEDSTDHLGVLPGELGQHFTYLMTWGTGLSVVATGDDINTSLSSSALRLKYYKYDQWQNYIIGQVNLGKDGFSGIFDFCRNTEPLHWKYFDIGESGHYTRTLTKSVGSPYFDFYVLPSSDLPVNSSVIPDYTDWIRFPWYQADDLVTQTQRTYENMFNNPIGNTRHPVFIKIATGPSMPSNQVGIFELPVNIETTGIRIPDPRMVASGVLLKLNNLKIKPSVWISGDNVYTFMSGITLPGSGFAPLLSSIQQIRRPLDFATNVAAVLKVPLTNPPTGYGLVRDDVSCCSGVSGVIYPNAADILMYDLTMDALLPTGLYTWRVSVTGIQDYEAQGKVSDCFGNTSGLTFLVQPYLGQTKLPGAISGTFVLGTLPDTSLDPQQDSFYNLSNQSQAPWGDTQSPSNSTPRIHSRVGNQFHWRITAQTGLCSDLHLSELTLPYLRIPEEGVDINIDGISIPVSRFDNAIPNYTGIAYTKPYITYGNELFANGTVTSGGKACWTIVSGTIDLHWTAQRYSVLGRTNLGDQVAGFQYCTGDLMTTASYFSLNNVCGPLINSVSLSDFAEIVRPLGTLDSWQDLNGIYRLSTSFASFDVSGKSGDPLQIVNTNFREWQNVFPVMKAGYRIKTNHTTARLSLSVPLSGLDSGYDGGGISCVRPLQTGIVNSSQPPWYPTVRDLPGLLCPSGGSIGDITCSTQDAWWIAALGKTFCVDRIDIELGVIRGKGAGTTILPGGCSGVISATYMPGFCATTSTSGFSTAYNNGPITTGSILWSKLPGVCESWWTA